MADPEAPDIDPEATNSEDPEGQEESIRQRLEALGAVPDLLRRAVVAGLGAFTGEEGIRRIAGEFSLPKDVASFLINQAQGTKEDILRVVARELRNFLEGLNLTDELTRMLTMISFEIKTEIRFIPNDKKLGRPRVKHRVALKRRRKGKEETVAEESSETEEDEKKTED
jgi:hypothetical protein